MKHHRHIHEGEPDYMRKLPLITAGPGFNGTSFFSLSNQSVVSDSPEIGSDSGSGESNYPSFIHRWDHDFSILSVIAAPERGLLFCGTQDSKILVFDFFTFEKKHELKGHNGAVLCLCVSRDENLLFSGGSDSLVKVWDLNEMTETHTIYSLVDIGDVFSVCWSDSMNTVFFGAQNASILWAHLEESKTKDNPSRLPSYRYDRFFDSSGPGGSKTPLQTSNKKYEGSEDSKLIEVVNKNVVKFAHNGYVYSMQIFDPREVDVFTHYSSEFISILISAGGDGKVNIWGTKCSSSLTLLHQLDNEDSVLSVVLKDSYLYCGLTDGQCKLWDLSTNQLIRSFQSDEGDVMSIATHNDCIFKATSKGVVKCKAVGDKISDWVTPDGDALTVSILQRNGSYYLIAGGAKSVCMYNITSVGDELHLYDSASARKSSIVDLTDDNLLDVLSKFVSYKTVSRNPELYIDDSRRCATFLKSLFMSFGATSRLVPVPDCNPIVYACFKANCAPSNSDATRILWYGHYDVVEAEFSDDWDTVPFDMTAKNGNLYGRGVSDNKGPILAAIFSVADLYREGKLSSDVVFLIEGEEESGSIGFQDVVSNNKELIGPIDWILLSNSYWLDDHTPCLNYGLRGVINASVRITSDKPDRHSGVDGGVSREATTDLIHLLSKLMDEKGKVLIPNFYDSVNPLTEHEQVLYKKITDQSDVSVETLLAKWRTPSVTIHKINVTGPNNNTVIPQAACASVSLRLVPNQSLEDVKRSLVEHIERCFHDLKTTNHLNVDIFHQAEPWLGDPTNAAFQILKKAVEKEWGMEPLFIREGGSIPSIRFLEKCFDAPAAQIPCGQSSDSAHLNNEKLRVINLQKLRMILTRTFTELRS